MTSRFKSDGVGSEIVYQDLLGFRLRRIAASTLEITNEIAIMNWIIQITRNKI